MEVFSEIKISKSKKELRLVLLPPKESKDVTEDDIKYFYKSLANILISEN